MPTQQRKSVLVVDDDEHALIFLEASLENEGYDTTTAWSAQEALELLRSRRFDLLLVDDYLPDCRGGLLAQIERMGVRSPMIAMQASPPSVDAMVQLASRGVCDVVCKWRLRELSEAVQSCLSGTALCRLCG